MKNSLPIIALTALTAASSGCKDPVRPADSLRESTERLVNRCTMVLEEVSEVDVHNDHIWDVKLSDKTGTKECSCEEIVDRGDTVMDCYYIDMPPGKSSYGSKDAREAVHIIAFEQAGVRATITYLSGDTNAVELGIASTYGDSPRKYCENRFPSDQSGDQVYQGSAEDCKKIAKETVKKLKQLLAAGMKSEKAKRRN
ncbi:hypothetical protein HZC21_00685 [Candidatus Peregrinibacteria bacterium]|nr:hypothetical protein [Candidatus Peregrinibacteria bacterium]